MGKKLVGRDAALAELRSAIWHTRVLTFTGPRGAGKSTLAVALATAVREDFVGGAWWADLSDTVDPNLVAQTVATAITPGSPVVDPETAIARRVAGSSLLVLDNCERVGPAVGKLVLDLCSRLPSLRVVVTTSEPLGIAGEETWRVPGLVVEGFSSAVGLESPPGDAAIALFVERARAGAGTFQPGYAGTREAIAEICLWLDGMPLAIELVAARAPTVTLSHIAEEFKRHADLQRSTGTGQGRHRSLDDTLEWSHQQLDSTDQLLFRRLAIFKGRFSPSAVEAICTDELVPEGELRDLLSVLIDHALLTAIDAPDGPSYRLLPSVRDFAARKLADSGELSGLRKRHAEYFYSLGVRSRHGIVGPEQGLWFALLHAELDNIRDALSWLFEHAPVEAADLVSALWPFAFQQGYYREARVWFEKALAQRAQLAPATCTDLLLKAAEVAFLQSDYAAATGHLQETMGMVGVDGDRYVAATALQRLGSISREQGRYAEARQFHDRSSAIWQALGEMHAVAASQNYLSFVGWLSGDFDLAEAAGSRALDEFHRGDYRSDIAVTLVNLGAGAMYRGDLDVAAQRLDRALEIAERLRFQEGVAWAMHELAILARRQRRRTREHELMLRDVLLVHQQLGDRWRIASVLEEIAGGVLVPRDPLLAVSMLGCAQALRDRIGTPISPAEQPDRDAAVSQLRQRLKEETFNAAWAQGRALDLAGAIDMATHALERPGASADGASNGHLAPILTPRELAVLELVGQGMSNREIGQSLYISATTAGVHVSDIARKLGARQRVDVAARARQLGLLPV